MEGQYELTRTTLAVLFVTGLIGISFWILWPFLPAIIWATTLVVATWPIMLQVQRRLWNKRAPAVAVMTIALLLIFVLPFWLAVATITQHFDRIAGWATSLAAFKLPPPPHWLAGLPFFGEQAALLWANAAASGIDPLVAKAAPYAGGAIFNRCGIAGIYYISSWHHRRTWTFRSFIRCGRSGGAGGGHCHIFRLVGLQAGSLGRDSLERGDRDAKRRAGGHQERFGRLRPAPQPGGGQDHALWRSH